jgi:hypothetical protein
MADRVVSTTNGLGPVDPWASGPRASGEPSPETGASQMNDTCTLREKVRDVIQAGKLPNRHPDRMWGGPGVGTGCAICSAPLKRDGVEFEIEFSRDGDDPGLDKYHVHILCFAAWESERQNLEVSREAAS